LARIGVVNRLEFRVGSSGGIWESTREAGERSSTSGGGDMDIGAKLYLWEEQGWLPESALLVGLSLPVGSKGFSSETSDPSFRMSLSHTLGNRFSLGYNLGASRESLPEDGSSFESLSVFNYTAVLGMGVTDRLGAFVEFFGDIPFRAQEPASHLFDGGITFLVWKNLQLDTSFGVGLSESAEDWFAGAGVSFRLPR